MSAPPNILLITSDQHRGDAFGFEGSAVRTPHLDLLAARGTRFSACITPNPVCQPARASMLTGMLPLTHGVHDNGIDLEQAFAQQGFAARLAEAGYATAFVGKAHFSTYHTFAPTDRPENVAGSAGFAGDWRGPYMGFQEVALMLIGHNYWLPERPPRGMHYERWYHAEGEGDLKDALYRQRLQPDAGAAQTHNSALPTAWHNSTWVADRTIDILRAGQAGGQPFCIWASFPDPHHPFDAPAPWCWSHRPEDISLPPHRVRDLERRPWWHRAAMEGTPGAAGEMGRVRREYSRMEMPDDERLRHVIANYYGMISLIDYNGGRILAFLAQAGLQENTVVVFTSDHGEWLGDHGLMLKGPMFYEGLLRVGLILRGPGIPGGRVVADPVSTVDLAATFAELAGTESDGAGQSTSLLPLVDGRSSRQAAWSEWRLGAARTGVELDLRTVRTGRAKLTYEFGSRAGEMYLLDEDPHEMQNRFEDAACTPLRKRLIELLHARPGPIRSPLPAPIGAA